MLWRWGIGQVGLVTKGRGRETERREDKEKKNGEQSILGCLLLPLPYLSLSLHCTYYPHSSIPYKNDAHTPLFLFFFFFFFIDSSTLLHSFTFSHYFLINLFLPKLLLLNKAHSNNPHFSSPLWTQPTPFPISNKQHNTRQQKKDQKQQRQQRQQRQQ